MVIEHGVVRWIAPPAPTPTLNRDQGLEKLDNFGRLYLDVRSEINDPGEPWLSLSMPAARPSQWVGRRDGGRIARDECAGQSACSLEESMLGGGTARLLATPMQVKLFLDLASLRVGPVTARRYHHGRRPEHELQVPACDRRRLVSFDCQDQAIPEVAFAGAGFR